jgi:hypothetical protein
MKKRLGELVWILLFNTPFYICYSMLFEYLFKLSTEYSLLLAFILLLRDSINEHQHDELKEKVKNIEDKISKL